MLYTCKMYLLEYDWFGSRVYFESFKQTYKTIPVHLEANLLVVLSTHDDTQIDTWVKCLYHCVEILFKM